MPLLHLVLRAVLLATLPMRFAIRTITALVVERGPIA